MAKLFSNISLEQRWRDSQYSSQINVSERPIQKAQPAPTINKSFANIISLKDRLKQSATSQTTKHLPEYFLSDVYTKYISIIPTKTYQHTSNIVIKKPTQTVAQSGTITIKTPTESILQGGVLPKYKNYDTLLLQGTTISNGSYSSFIIINNPNTSVNQGPGINPTLSVVYINQGTGTTPNPSIVFVNQGAGVDPIKPISIIDLGFLQGLSTGRGGVLTSLTPIKLAIGSRPVEVPKSIIIINAKPTPNQYDPTKTINTITFIPKQGETTPAKITFIPATKSPTLNLLRYEADRALAYYSPIIKHGYTELDNYPTGAGNTDGASIYYYNNLDGVDIPTDVADISLRMGDNILTDIEELVFRRSQTNNRSTIARNLAEKKDSYTTLNYDTIVDRSKTPSPNRGKKGDFNGIKSPSKRELGPLENKYPTTEKDIVVFKIASLTGQGSVQFRAYLTSFNDSYTPTWNDINYVGRQDTLKTFKGVTRSVSVGFKVAAFTYEEHKECYEKLNKLVKIAAVGTFGDKYLIGPLCSFTLGNWLINTPCAATSLKYDIDNAENSWDIDSKLPQLVSVSMDFVILGDNNGKPLNAKTNKYFNYKW